MSQQLVFNPELLGELKELMKIWTSSTTLCLKHLEEGKYISFQNITRARNPHEPNAHRESGKEKPPYKV